MKSIGIGRIEKKNMLKIGYITSIEVKNTRTLETLKNRKQQNEPPRIF